MKRLILLFLCVTFFIGCAKKQIIYREPQTTSNTSSEVLSTAGTKKYGEYGTNESGKEEREKDWVAKYGVVYIETDQGGIANKYVTIIGKSAAVRDDNNIGLQAARDDAYNDLKRQFIQYIGMRSKISGARERGYDYTTGKAVSNFSEKEQYFWDGVFGQLLIVDTYKKQESSKYGDRFWTMYLKGQMLESKLSEAFENYKNNFTQLRELDRE